MTLKTLKLMRTLSTLEEVRFLIVHFKLYLRAISCHNNIGTLKIVSDDKSSKNDYQHSNFRLHYYFLSKREF